jgi:hypothetical protein
VGDPECRHFQTSQTAIRLPPLRQLPGLSRLVPALGTLKLCNVVLVTLKYDDMKF